MTDKIRDRIDNASDKGIGNAKEAFGDATGDQQTKRQGQADQAQGEAKDAISDAKDKGQDLLDKVKGS